MAIAIRLALAAVLCACLATQYTVAFSTASGFVGGAKLFALRGPLKALVKPPVARKSVILPAWRAPKRAGLRTMQRMQAEEATKSEEAIGSTVPENILAVFDTEAAFVMNELVIMKQEDGSR